MGLFVTLFAVGRFHASVASAMDFEEPRYKLTRDGAIVTRRLFGIIEGNTTGRVFAKLLGIDAPWDFSQHLVDSKKIDVPGLQRFVAEFSAYDNDLAALLVLIHAGFEIHFRPEG
jgi:hypothetical protein